VIPASRVRSGLAAFTLVFVAAHIPFLPPTLEDIDSINFALGVADFDVARHQPHPPGYPVFIALGKVSTGLLRAATVPSPEPQGLAVWSVLSGAVLIYFLFSLFRALGEARPVPAASARLDDVWRAAWATVIAALSPLFWFTALRPLSDMTGLAAAVGAQALIVSAVVGRGGPRELMLGALVAGLAIGVRSQTALLTLPLLALALVLPRPGLRLRDRLVPLGAATAGVLVWAIPLIVASGGLASYAAALGRQAGEDFSGVVMLWRVRTARVALDTALNSFLWPWGYLGAGGAVVAMACAGCVRVAWQMPRTLGLLAVAFVPYAVFHLLFQETATVRYALPLVIPIAYLVACALELGGRTTLAVGATALAASSLFLALPASAAYGREGSPTFRALREVREMASGPRAEEYRLAMGAPPDEVSLGFHAVARRAVEWESATLPRLLKAPHAREWLALVQAWRGTRLQTALFLADPRRTDLALFDGGARRLLHSYRWPFVVPPFVGGARPGDTDLYLMRAPGWMLDTGWALTAEAGGVTARDGLGPHRQPSVAWIRTRSDDALLMIGGRHVGPAGDPDVRVALGLKGRQLHAFGAKPGFFFQVVPVAAGMLVASDPYVPLEVTSAAADDRAREVPVTLEQFDLQSAGMPMVGAEDGWHEPEYSPSTGRAWRWVSERGTLWVRPIGRDVTLTLAGESPLRYFAAAPTVTVTAGARPIARFSPSSDFTQEMVLPADALASADGRVVIESDDWFIPGERDGSADRRHLALRIYSFAVR
jgi:hypothetical protein